MSEDKFSSEIISGEENLYYQLGYRYFRYVQKSTLHIGLHHFTLVLLFLYLYLVQGVNYIIPIVVLVSMILVIVVLKIQLSEKIYYAFFSIMLLSIVSGEYSGGAQIDLIVDPLNDPIKVTAYSLLAINLVVMVMFDTFTLQSVNSRRVITPATQESREAYGKFKGRLKGTSFAITDSTKDSMLLNRRYLFLQLQTIAFFVVVILLVNSFFWNFVQIFYHSGNIFEAYYTGTLTLFEFGAILYLLRLIYIKKKF